jgi:hypothetical protein
MSSLSLLCEAVKAENLLKDSYVFTQIEELKKSLRYKSNGDEVSFNDFFDWLNAEDQKLPKLNLSSALSPGTEAKYLNDLITSLEAVNDEVDRILTKNLNFQSKVMSALDQSKTLKNSFVAWYSLALNDYIHQNGIKGIPASSVKALSEAEFSRLMGGTEVELEILLEAIKVQGEKLKRHKKLSQEKYDLGKDQANALWTTSLPFGSVGIPEGRSGREFILEDSEEATAEVVPDFISRKPTISEEKSQEPELPEPPKPLKPPKVKVVLDDSENEPAPVVPQAKTEAAKKIIVRSMQEFPDKIKCAQCNKRIREGQNMFQTGENWNHAEEENCSGVKKEEPVKVEAPSSNETNLYKPVEHQEILAPAKLEQLLRATPKAEVSKPKVSFSYEDNDSPKEPVNLFPLMGTTGGERKRTSLKLLEEDEEI